MNTENQIAQFKHRDIANISIADPVNVYATVAEPVNAILTFAQLLSDNLPELTADDINRNLLAQLKLNALDVLSITEGLVNSFDFVAILDEEETDKEEVETPPSLSTIGGEFADNILDEFSQSEDMSDLERIAVTYSKSISKYTHQLSDLGNEALLEALLMKFLVAGVPSEEDTKVSEVDKEEVENNSNDKLPNHLAAGKFAANDALIELENTGDIKGIAKRFSEYFIQFSESNEYEPTLAIMTAFLTKMLETTPQSKKTHADKEQPEGLLEQSSVIGKKIGKDFLVDLKQAPDAFGVEDLALNVSERLAHLSEENSHINSHSILNSFLLEIISALPEDEVKKAA